MFLPTTQKELKQFGWNSLDVILVTGDTYIDSPYIGVSIIGKVLLNAGYKVGIIAQPDPDTERDITRLGEPELFWGITAGSLDSMVANYTALKKWRKNDDFTPGGKNNRRPDRASIVYTNLIKRYFKDTKPLVLGGIEASMRRIAHYDFWDNRIRRSILFDAKADILVYGMGEKTILQLSEILQSGGSYSDLRGICYINKQKKSHFTDLPSYPEVKKNNQKFIQMFSTFYTNNDPLTANGLNQKHDTRYLIHNPPNYYLSQTELDDIYALDYEREVHPYYRQMGKVKAQETIKFSIPSHRGCYGECNFCSIAVHQGATVRSRSEESIIKEVKKLTQFPDFKGYIFDVGGPTANMYEIECSKKINYGKCQERRCLYPTTCKKMKINHGKQIKLLRKLQKIKGIKKVFIGSGIRHDLVLQDNHHGDEYLRELVSHHISGQLKIAPEHSEQKILNLMGKPTVEYLTQFKKKFDGLNNELNKKQFLTYYFIVSHPGADFTETAQLKTFINTYLHISPQQVQIFTPLPSTYSSLMYYTEINPFTGEKIFVQTDRNKKQQQKKIIVKRH